VVKIKRQVYIFNSGRLERFQNTLRFTTTLGERKVVPVTQIYQIFVFGELTVNKRALEFLAKRQVALHFFDYYGNYVGSFWPKKQLNSGWVIIKQCEHYLNKEKRLLLAKKFVIGGIKNMLQNLFYYHRRGISQIDRTIRKINFLGSTLQRTREIPELMGLEGKIRKEYYLAFNSIIKNADFSFKIREKHPPTTPLNALISFGNSLLYAVILKEIYNTHLDPRVAFLHESKYRAFSLHLDVAEIFKPILVDRLIFKLTNKKIVTIKDFQREGKAYFLNNNGKRKFVEHFDKKLGTTIKIKRKKRSYRQIIRIELYKLERHLLGDTLFEPFEIKW